MCNGLLATVGLGQRRGDDVEPAIVTSGVTLREVARFLTNGRSGYSAADVVAYLTAGRYERLDVQATTQATDQWLLSASP